MYDVKGKLSNVQSDLRFLQTMNWIDRETRAVFIEFILYNPNSGLITICTLLTEVLPTGNLVQSIRTEPLNFSDIKNEAISVKSLLFSLYALVVVFLIIKQIRAILKLKFHYFKKFST